MRRITEDSDPDLFWALRGGGGDFGIVTAVDLCLYPAPELYGGRLLWPAEHARDVLTAYLAVTAHAPDELSAWANLLQFPPLPEVPEPLRGGTFVSVDVTYLGSAEDAESFWAPPRGLNAPMRDTMGAVAIAELDAIAAEPTDPMPLLHHAALLNQFDEPAVDGLLDAVGPGTGSALIIVQLRHLGGALARALPTDHAAGPIAAGYQVLALGAPSGPDGEHALHGDIGRLSQVLTPYDTGKVAFTFLSPNDTVDRAYPAETVQRLRTIKTGCDPRGVIRSNHPVTH